MKTEAQKIQWKRWYAANRETYLARQREKQRGRKQLSAAELTPEALAKLRVGRIRSYYKRKPDYKLVLQARHRARRMRCLNAYGGPICACCGDTHQEFLVIDHIDGGGNQHRRDTKVGGGSSFYCWLVRNHFPQGFRVLCHNCNFSRAAYGCCPHEIELDHAVEELRVIAAA